MFWGVGWNVLKSSGWGCKELYLFVSNDSETLFQRNVVANAKFNLTNYCAFEHSTMRDLFDLWRQSKSFWSIVQKEFSETLQLSINKIKCWSRKTDSIHEWWHLDIPMIMGKYIRLMNLALVKSCQNIIKTYLCLLIK